MHAAVICFRVETSERAVAATAAAVVVTVASSSSSSSPPLPLPRARAFPCAGVRAEALRSTGCSDSDGCSTRRDASQCAVAFFPTINGVASNPGTAGAFDFFTRLTSRCLPECGESRPNVGFRRVASRQERSTGSLEVAKKPEVRHTRTRGESVRRHVPDFSFSRIDLDPFRTIPIFSSDARERVIATRNTWRVAFLFVN
ncbi:uncharacterized protein LOC120357030 isoform X1 [Solenopsis invicta]|uniref:uncharacterized protein LOC120357030 isoform X1 n=1 Tax=Solenopsis invicta TaxID=13686 RepID=UPI00193E6237|nr:uncharacterized protein LOC120357030 isoform X1 [Solenopsis invicta]